MAAEVIEFEIPTTAKVIQVVLAHRGGRIMGMQLNSPPTTMLVHTAVENTAPIVPKAFVLLRKGDTWQEQAYRLEHRCSLLVLPTNYHLFELVGHLLTDETIWTPAEKAALELDLGVTLPADLFNPATWKSKKP